MGGSISILNHTEVELNVSLDQIGPIFYHNRLQPGEMHTFNTGWFWFTVTAQDSAEGRELCREDISTPLASFTCAMASKLYEMFNMQEEHNEQNTGNPQQNAGGGQYQDQADPDYQSPSKLWLRSMLRRLNLSKETEEMLQRHGDSLIDAIDFRPDASRSFGWNAGSRPTVAILGPIEEGQGQFVFQSV